MSFHIQSMCLPLLQYIAAQWNTLWLRWWHCLLALWSGFISGTTACLCFFCSSTKPCSSSNVPLNNLNRTTELTWDLFMVYLLSHCVLPASPGSAVRKVFFSHPPSCDGVLHHQRLERSRSSSSGSPLHTEHWRWPAVGSAGSVKAGCDSRPSPWFSTHTWQSTCKSLLNGVTLCLICVTKHTWETRWRLFKNKAVSLCQKKPEHTRQRQSISKSHSKQKTN